MNTPLRPAGRDESGFAVIAVLIVISLMLSLGLTYMQHSALETESSLASRDRIQAAEDVDSSLAFARTSLAAGQATGSRTITVGGSQVTVDVQELSSDGHMRWDLVCTDDNSLGTTILAESGKISAPGEAAVSHPDLLPQIEGDLLSDLLADPDLPVTAYSGVVELDGVTIDGLLVLETGATITVRDVVVNGAVLSREALESDAKGAFDDSTAPELIIDGTFMVSSGSDVEGVAVLMPDGKITTGAGMDESFQLLGAVVAHTIELTAPGTVDGAVAFSQLTLSDDVDRPGFGREPQQLPDTLDPGAAWQDSFFAIVPLAQTADELTGITDFWKQDP